MDSLFMRQLMGDKAVLQDAASKLNTQMREAERRADDAERAGERVSLSHFLIVECTIC